MRSSFLVLAFITSLVVPATIASCGDSGSATTQGDSNTTGGGDDSSGKGGGTGNNGPGLGAGGGSGGGFNPVGSGGGPPCEDFVSCEDQGKDCGPVADGCGNVLECGDCTGNESCGGGGEPSVCGVPTCTPITCQDQGIECGPAGDGCGNSLDCGTCTGTDTCGGGGPGICGTQMTCTPETCGSLGYNCGPAGDGCGNPLDCGTCTSPDICGGAGVPSVCGVPPCDAQTCADFGAGACGPIGDGCGGLIQCGGCNLPEQCGALTPSQCGIPASCTNLCLQQVSCPGGGTTTITGTVYAPNGVDPLPNILVYIPNSPVQPFSAGVSCDQCADGVSGSPLVSAATGTDGTFTLSNVPVGANIPLVMQTGRWRRQITLSNVTACVPNPAPAAQTRLPRNQNEGDIPKMAFVTGAVDVLECVLRKIGVQDSEFTNPSGSGRINLYQGNGTVNIPGLGNFNLGGARINASTPSETALVQNPATLANYDMVLFPCKGAQFDRTNPEKANLVSYANAGGRVFATHFSYVWLYNNNPFNTTATWQINQGNQPDQNGFIVTSFPKGQALADWLQFIGASTTYGRIPLVTLKRDTNGVVAPSQEWMHTNGPAVTMTYTFNTPVGSPAAQQCGRINFQDFHVENKGFVDCPPGAGCTPAQTNAYNTTFPAACAAGAMTPQEKLLMFMIFDLGSCVTPDIPVCNPVTCNSQNIECGPAGNGCGGLLDCGTCTPPETCGGGGQPSQCGTPTCNGLSCSQQGIECGPAGDGCGNPLNCGPCPPGQTCGGGGQPGVCGSGTCTPTTCAAQGIECGPAGDGCGNSLACGSCPAGQSCGGGGTPGECGTQCQPRTCAQLGFDCGPAGDGCGGQLQCGTCTPPQTCGGGGTPNKCGGGVPG